MGIEFRKGNYVRRVRCGKRTIKEGEACVIWNRSGRMREVHGGRLVHLWFSTIRFLDSYSARDNQYLRVVSRKGEVKHIPGPILFYRNPVYHEKVSVHNTIKLESPAQTIILYSATKSGKEQPALPDDGESAKPNTVIEDNVEIRVISGPKIVLPAVREWVHEFKWTKWETFSEHESSGEISSAKEVETKTVLSTSEQEKIITKPVRSSDGGLFYVTMSVKFQITDVNMLLKNSSDLPFEMCSAIQADLAILGSSMHSQDHLVSTKKQDDTATEEAESSLSALSRKIANVDESFLKLKQCCSTKGVNLNSVQLVGLEASSGLDRRYQEFAQQAATLQHEMQKAEQRHQMEDRELEIAAQRHQVEMEALERTAELEKRKADLRSEQRVAENDEVLGFLKELKKEGVDLNEALKALSGMSFYGKEPTGAFKAIARAPALGLRVSDA